MKLLELRLEASKRLKSIGDMSSREADWIIEHILDCDKTYLLVNADLDIDIENEKNIYNLIDRRLNGEPLQYLIGSESFMGLEFQVTPDVLIPRFDTEILVNKTFDLIDEIMAAKPKSSEIKILDIGTGSGIIPIIIAKNYENVNVVGVDISNSALEVAKQNAKRYNLEGRVSFLQSDLFSAFLNDENIQYKNLENKNIKFDIIVSNPPYIPTDDIADLQKELQYEPKLALDGGKDGYDFYRNIIAYSCEFINNDGWLIMETGHNQARKISDMMVRDFKKISIYKDSQSIERVVCGSLR